MELVLCSFFKKMKNSILDYDSDLTYYGLIEYVMCISTYKDYVNNKAMIMEKYKTYDVKKKVIYRDYIFSRPLISEKKATLIWDELNGFLWNGDDIEGTN